MTFEAVGHPGGGSCVRRVLFSTSLSVSLNSRPDRQRGNNATSGYDSLHQPGGVAVVYAVAIAPSFRHNDKNCLNASSSFTKVRERAREKAEGGGGWGLERQKQIERESAYRSHSARTGRT